MGAGLQRAAAAAKRTRYPNTPAPAVGQRWRDNDKRCNHQREVVILAIAPNAALSDVATCDVYIDGTHERSTRIACSRFVPKATGYRYVGKGAPVAQVAP